MDSRFAVVNLDQSPRRFEFMHESEYRAKLEAERLARTVSLPHTGQRPRFAVVEVIAVVQLQETPVTWEEVRRADPPF